MGNEYQRPIGLTIHLEKYGLNKFDRYSWCNNTRILGHYDTLKIETIYKWFEFSPKVDWNLSRPRTEPLIVSRYPIKLLFPEQSVMRIPKLEYEGWERPEDLLSDNPYITVVLVKLTDGFKGSEFKDLFCRFTTAVIKNAEKTGLDLSEVNCGIFPSLGYSDFCILCAGKKWRPSLDLIENLHAMLDDDGTPILSTDYMITALHGLPSEKSMDAQLSVRLNLSPGYTAQTLAKLVPAGVEVYRTSGGSDCALFSKTYKASSDLINFLLQGNSGASNFIIDMASALLLRVKKESGDIKELILSDKMRNCEKTKQKILDEVIAPFLQAVSDYENMLTSNKRPTRQVNILREIAVTFENIALQNHSAQISAVLKPFFQHFTNSLKLCVTQVKMCDHDLNLIVRMEQEVSIFCDYIVSYLADLSRSDCFFMEREKYNHPSISSSTKLLLAFNRWLNDVTELVQKTTLPENLSEYSFLVTSGGCDQTQNFDAFHFLEPEDKSNDIFERIPNIVQLSEMSIFDFSGTILRTVHECMHNCGERLRNVRVDCLFMFVSQMYATIISRAIFQEERYVLYAETVITKLFQENLNETDMDTIRGRLKSNHAGIEKSLISKISDYILEQLRERKSTEWTEAQILSKNIRDWLIVELAEIFSVYKSEYTADGHESLHFSELAKILYDNIQQANKEYLELCDNICLEFNIPTKVFSFDLERYSIIAPTDVDKFDSERTNDRTVNRLVQVVLSHLTMSGDIFGHVAFLFDSKPEGQIQRFPYATLAEQNIWDVLQVCVDVFSETFADMVACMTLGAEFEDYILMHIFEDWDLAESLDTCSFANQMRIPAVLELCFSNSLTDESGHKVVTQEAKTRVKKAVDCLIAHGMPSDRLVLTDMWKRINQLLTEWENNKEIGECLLIYLRACHDIYAEPDIMRQFVAIRSTYNKIKLRKIDADSDEYRGKINQMVNLFTEWGGGCDNA